MPMSILCALLLIQYGYSAIMLAAGKGHVKIVNMLMNAGVEFGVKDVLSSVAVAQVLQCSCQYPYSYPNDFNVYKGQCYTIRILQITYCSSLS